MLRQWTHSAYRLKLGTTQDKPDTVVSDNLECPRRRSQNDFWETLYFGLRRPKICQKPRFLVQILRKRHHNVRIDVLNTVQCSELLRNGSGGRSRVWYTLLVPDYGWPGIYTGPL